MNECGVQTDLNGRRAIVTGASRGIGRAIAEGLASCGADIALVSRKAEGLEEVATAIRAMGREALVVPANLSIEEDVERVIPEIAAAWGGFDILVNNAGTNPAFVPLSDLDPNTWDKIFATNLNAPFRLTRTAAEHLMESGRGSVINISSVGGLTPAANLGAYSVSKAALISLTKAFALEMGGSNVRVNCIAPGLVETKFAEMLVNTPSIHDRIIATTPLGRHAQPDEIAGAAVYLASDASSFMTGQVLVLDGGTHL